MSGEYERSKCAKLQLNRAISDILLGVSERVRREARAVGRGGSVLLGT